MPSSTAPAFKSRTSSKRGAKAHPGRIKGTRGLIRPSDLRAYVAETVQRLQSFHQSLEASGSAYSPKRLQTLAQRLAAIRDQSKHLPKFQEMRPAGDRPTAPRNGRVGAARPQPPAAVIPARSASVGLRQVQALVEATSDLRAASGNLCANAVADTFGISVNQLAGWLGRSRQALSKTPDAASLQDELAAFEQVARLRTVLAPGAFRKWLRMPNGQLDGARPLDLLVTGQRRAIVAGLVEDMLTGMPT